MTNNHYDLFIIGAGSGGVRAARIAASLGAKVAIAEEKYLGGTCVNVGCVPKKLFVYASSFIDEFHAAENYGWDSGTLQFDWHTLVKNKNKEIERLNSIYGRLLSDSGVELFNGRATLVDSNTIQIDDQTISAKNILIATGAWPMVPEIHGSENVITSNEAFYLESLPDRIVVVGGGYIAVEFAGIFNGLGVDTTLVYRGPLILRSFDEEMRQFLTTEIQKKGVKLITNNTIESIEKKGTHYELLLADNSELSTDMIMCATGRAPNSNGLGLKNAGIDMDTNGAIKINKQYQTSNPSIYAIGDVTDRYALTPVAIAEGMSVAHSLYGKNNYTVDYTNIPSCIFSQPNFATVGYTEEQAKENYSDIQVFKSEFTHLKHSLSGMDEKTLMKLIVDKQTDRVIGAHMIGHDAGEIIQGLAIAIKAGVTKEQMDTTIGIHPTAAEEFVTMRDPA
ncbi:MAG: glutathione-disulfide reductase [Gammaproteobacteria bacterium]|nr:glutathione-disulfide reductase [Gammaproteobacteria bacterium]